MKKLYFILSFFILTACQKDKDNQSYEWVDISLEAEIHLLNIQMLTEDIGYVAGFAGSTPLVRECYDAHLQSDTNYISIDNSLPISSCYIIDTIKSLTSMYKTTDGGRNWRPVNLPFSKYKNMSFVDENCGFVLSYDGLYKTVNGGNTWKIILENKAVMENNTITPAFDKIKFINNNTGFLFSNNFRGDCLLVSVTGNGDLKNIISKPFDNPVLIPFVNKIEHLPAQPDKVYFLTLDRLYKSDENSANWHLLQDSVSFNDVSFINESVCFATLPGLLFKSSDGGENWDKIATVAVPFNKLKAINENLIYISDNADIYKSEDGGINFRQMSKPAGEITQFCFPTAETGFAIGPNGTILKYSGK